MTEIIDAEQISLPFETPNDREVRQSVEEFMMAFDASTDPALWGKLVDEELTEIEEALANLLKEVADLEYVIAGARATGYASTDEALEQRLARAWQIRVSLGEERVMEAFRRVHKSNMSKLGDDGKPMRREDGKILKGPNYKPPYLGDLI